MTAIVKMLSGPVDPDLEQALPELAMAARRIRQLESIISLPDGRYEQRAAQLAERGDLNDRFEARAAKLGIPGERPGKALRMMVDEFNRLSDLQRRRRPTLAQILSATEIAADAAKRDAAETECDLIAARYAEARARQRAAAGAAAVQYLEACR